MSVHLQADLAVVNDLLARITFTSFNSLVQARVQLAEQLRLSMKHPQCYNIPIGQQLPEGMGAESAAQYVHPWNIACALGNVCVSGPRFGGDILAPQEDLQVYAGEWRPMGAHSFPTAVVPMTQPEPEAQPAPLPESFSEAPPTLADSFSAGDMTDAAAQGFRDGAAAAAASSPSETNAPQESAAALPDPDIQLARVGGQTGRPQKSPFEKKMEPRKKIADPPFWWGHMLISAPKLFAQSPAGALDDSSSGVGPVQAYMMLLALQLKVLEGAPGDATVAQLRNHLASINKQVSALPTADAANQLRDALIGK